MWRQQNYELSVYKLFIFEIFNLNFLTMGQPFWQILIWYCVLRVTYTYLLILNQLR